MASSIQLLIRPNMGILEITGLKPKNDSFDHTRMWGISFHKTF